MRYIFLLFYLFFISAYAQELKPHYLNTSLSVDERIDDLMSRMTLYEKACQMNQFVGLEHMKKAEKDLSAEDMKKSDAQGFYKGVFSEDVKQMVISGQIGSFLHVVTVCLLYTSPSPRD